MLLWRRCNHRFFFFVNSSFCSEQLNDERNEKRFWILGKRYACVRVRASCRREWRMSCAPASMRRTNVPLLWYYYTVERFCEKNWILSTKWSNGLFWKSGKSGCPLPSLRQPFLSFRICLPYQRKKNAKSSLYSLQRPVRKFKGRNKTR